MYMSYSFAGTTRQNDRSWAWKAVYYVRLLMQNSAAPTSRTTKLAQPAYNTLLFKCVMPSCFPLTRLSFGDYTSGSTLEKNSSGDQASHTGCTTNAIDLKDLATVSYCLPHPWRWPLQAIRSSGARISPRSSGPLSVRTETGNPCPQSRWMCSSFATPWSPLPVQCTDRRGRWLERYVEAAHFIRIHILLWPDVQRYNSDAYPIISA